MPFINEYPYSDFHELNLDWLIAKTKETIVGIKYLEEEFAKIVVVTEDHIQNMIDISIAQNNVKLAQDLQALHDQITAEYINYVSNRIAQLTTYIDNQDAHYDQLAHSYAAQALTDSKAYTDDKVMDYTMMINPITGQYEDVRIVVDDIVSYFHTENALTAGEYDILELTAGDYDAYQLTAYDYDFNGKIRLVPNP